MTSIEDELYCDTECVVAGPEATEYQSHRKAWNER